MINIITQPNKKSKINLGNLFNDMFLLPNWEVIKEFNISQKKLFKCVVSEYKLLRKFSSKNMIEKYAIKSADDVTSAVMDLKVYKDNVYIINIDTLNMSQFNGLIPVLLQTAAEKALYNTTDKEVRINLLMPMIKKYKMKNMLLNMDFKSENQQSSFEKEMFGETFYLKIEDSVSWQRKIKQMPILINN